MPSNLMSFLLKLLFFIPQTVLALWGSGGLTQFPGSRKVVPAELRSQPLRRAIAVAARIWLPRSGNVRCCPQNEIYDIETEILYFQCFVTTDMFLFCKTILYNSGNCRIFRDLAFGSIKTRFKAILKKQDFSAQIDFFMNFCPRRATKLRSL